MAKYTITVNGRQHTVEADPDTPLLWVVRDYIGLTGTKYGCGMSLCGACTVHLNGQPVRACSTQISSIRKSAVITTIEGLSANTDHTVQQAWIAEQVPQCGYCHSGIVMAAAALLRQKPNPTDADIDLALSGHLCRCGTYPRIRKAVHKAATLLKEQKSDGG